MGANMASRLLEKGFTGLVVYNRSPDKVEELVRKGARGASSMEDLVKKLPSPRVVWLMLPSGEPTESHFQEALRLLERGDIIVDGANSNFHDSIRRHAQAKASGIRMLDVGVSGGVVAAERGYAMMVGGDPATFAFVEPAISMMCAQGAYALVGEEGGSGHYVKMVHNAIEYGMMQAIAEGFDLLRHGRFPALDTTAIATLWNRGTIVQSFLMEMTMNALKKDGDLSRIAPFVEDNGEGRWSAIEALEHGVPFTVNTHALYARYASRDPDSFALKLLAAMREEFGGHRVKESTGKE
jgi:6-phosphogluconate dehydrogenase